MGRKIFLDYVWEKMIRPQIGYSFSIPHDVMEIPEKDTASYNTEIHSEEIDAIYKQTINSFDDVVFDDKDLMNFFQEHPEIINNGEEFNSVLDDFMKNGNKIANISARSMFGRLFIMKYWKKFKNC